MEKRVLFWFLLNLFFVSSLCLWQGNSIYDIYYSQARSFGSIMDVNGNWAAFGRLLDTNISVFQQINNNWVHMGEISSPCQNAVGFGTDIAVNVPENYFSFVI